MTSKEMPDFDSMSPEELKEQYKALQEERVNFERERDLFEAQRKETGTEVRVFVGNLDPKTDEDILRSYFVKFGPLKNVFVLRNPDGTSKRSGFVTFYYTSQAKLACDEMNNKYKDSNEQLPLQVKFAHVRQPHNAAQRPAGKQPMPPARPEQQAFAPYGGFPMYQQQPAFPAFVPQMPAPPFPPAMAPGMQPQGHYGPVHRATNPGALDGGNTNVSLYINHIGPHVTEEVLRQAFAVHGNVASVKIMREHGYGFVQFPDPAAAAQAMAALNNNMELSSGTPLQVSLKTASKKKPGFNATPAYPAPPKRYTPY